MALTLQEFYTAVGGDYQDALGRMMGESMLRKFVLKFPNDPSFTALTQAIETGSREDAFRAAHTIKGLCLNLGFGKLLHSSQTLTEALRSEFPNNTAELFASVKEDYHLTVDAIAQL
ncbi:MAG: Hpt domain-containing protein [Oscillospiraceae bacterium]|nr:Hpt domain-containing protein [Oscillospiraceae bacterium]